ncbi:hypothetical protein [Labedaea rhizosphaerae]|uniref:Uncharacterized protein n=1 Tax=Labedaea rhizosphaerae TaxID=598644 RepID=A0A4R6S503_LABRH|nr:hypothetical protein [Labedaea rhizosphaerae]TDP94812.1 hypothetical protein EV186_10544 [Labedaea rhizosphaerae]
MAQTTVSRRRPCTTCGGRYFVRTISVVAALIATAVALGGIAKAVVSSGVLTASNAHIPDQSQLVLAGAWAIGGILVAGIIATVASGHRCIACDTKQ